MRFNPGTRLGRYEIRSKLGAGGMGEVYQGRDTQLGRDVAVKVLPTTVSTDPDRLRRFEQEARAASALNHPNILIVHDIGAHDGTTYVVSELLEGETLRKRIAGTPLAQRRVIDYAVQIANGLAAAHAKGIIHRDLKPDNVFVTNDGRVKILDFGLAKLTQLDGDQAAQTDIPTRRVDTDPGVVMGTVGYMSPEQLKGGPLDQRSDIFSFGAILYEMLSGRRAFHGESAAETMSAILREDPPELSETNVSPALERLVNHCLEKNREERFHSSRDVAFALESLSGSVPASTHQAAIPARASRAIKRSELIAWTVAALALVITVVVSIAYFRRPAAEVHAVRSFILPPEKSSFDFSARLGSTIALSPDGRRVAFVAAVEGKQLLWIRSLDVLSVQSLAGTEGAIFPFWSKDSRFVGFFAEQKLKKIDVAGGPPITLCDAPDARGGTWNRDGVIVFAPTSTGVLHRVPASGGTSTPITKLDETAVETSHRWPFFLPDGDHFLYLGGGGLTIGEGAVISVGSLRNNDRKMLMSADSNAAYAQGYLLFLRERTLMAQAFDAKRLETTDDAFPIAEQVQSGRVPGTGIFSVSDDGVLAYQSGPGQSGSQLTWFGRTNKPIGNLGDPAPYNSFCLSPDAKSVTVSVSNQAGISNVWLYEVARGVKTPFTFGPAQTRAQVWSPDGDTIVFASNRTGHFDLYRKASSGAGSEQLLIESNLSKIPTGFSPDGRFLLYNVTDPKTKVDVWVLPLDGSREPFPFLQGDFNENNAQFSPDGRWIAYQSNESNRYEIYVTPFPGASGKRQISTSGGRLPEWRRNEIFYLSLDNKLMVSEVTAQGDTLEVGAAHPLFEIRPGGPGNIYDVTADGQRFLINTAVEQQITLPITLVLNWTTDLKK
jgi:serine/threonine protein kinase/Tol biopolymer transport system component